jgi:glycosyltransferase involved in cell wall biosynthesis
LRVALVHDWLTGTRGGEKVLLELARMFPEAVLFTLFHFPGSVPQEIERLEIRTTFLQRLVSRERDYRRLLPLFFVAAETWDLGGFDLVVSSSHCVAKNARAATEAFHACYCHTPVRYLHDQFEAYFQTRSWPVSTAARAVRIPLRAWDRFAARRVDTFLANSENVRERIARHYGRSAEVVPPPADLEFYTPAEPGPARSGFLIVSAMAPYKRIDDAILAANREGIPLTIAGFGPDEHRLRALAGDSVVFAGSPSDERLRDLYRGAEAVLMPGEEDFGIVPVEAQACGTPVIALGRGGALETVRHGETGFLYEPEGTGESGADALLRAIHSFRSLRLDGRAARENVARFSQANFRSRFLGALTAALSREKKHGMAEWLAARLDA